MKFTELPLKGAYIIEPELLELIPGGTYFDMTDLIQKVIENTL